LHLGALAVYALGDVALEGIHGSEIFDFHTSIFPALRGLVTHFRPHADLRI
jgi:hypothetical protein